MPTLLERERAPEVVFRIEGPTGRGSGGRERRRLSLGSLVTTAGLGAIALVVLMVAGTLTGLIDIGNPFGSTTVDHSPPVLLKELTNLSEYTAARGAFQSTINLDEDVGVLPDFISGENVTFLARGYVDASVDFSRLTIDAIVIGSDDAVTITLPRPELDKPVIDAEKSRVADRDRGIVERLSGVFEDDPTSERPLYILAGRKMAKAARESGLSSRAERNTEEMLVGLLNVLGYSQVDVVFGQPLAAADQAPADRPG